MNIIRALNDPKVFGSYCRSHTWTTWRVFLAALFGLPLGYDQLQLFKQCTGRSVAPTSPLQEAWLVVGRRGGKSFILGSSRYSWPVSETGAPISAPAKSAPS